MNPPELPDGYFWRVGPEEGQKWHRWECYLKGYGVSLRYKTWYGSKALYRSPMTDPDFIARHAYQLRVKLDADNSRAEQVAKTSGDYQPKKWSTK